MWILLALLVSTTIAQSDSSCGDTGSVSLHAWEGYGWYVTYRYPCDGHNILWPFCEGSGWGDEEATVACRESGYNYGLGRLVQVSEVNAGIRGIECDGSEDRLKECEIEPVTFEPCNYVAAATCSNVSQVYVKDLINSPQFPSHLTGEEGQTVRVCLEIPDAVRLSESLHLTLTTTVSTSGLGYQNATASSDYVPLNQTVVFEPSSMTMLERCVEIEIIDDSLTEPWEVFSVLMSTTTSAVEIINPLIDIYIPPNDGSTSPTSKIANINPSSTSGLPVSSQTSSLVPTIIDVSQPSPIGYSANDQSPIIKSSSAPTSSHAPPTNTEGSRSTNSGLIAGITVSILVLLLAVPLSLVLILLWLRWRSGHHLFTKPTPTQVLASTEENGLVDKRLPVTNPTYQPTTCVSPSPEVEQRPNSPEHHFRNPLYTPLGAGVTVVSGSTESTPVAPQETVYEYVETGFTRE